MKAAAAVLGVSLLFFVGVLTGAGRREAIPPPAAIPLGVGPAASGVPAEPAPAPPSAPPGTPQTPARPGANPSPATTATTGRTDATGPARSPNPSAPVEPPAATTSTTGGTDATAPPTSTPTTAGPVEEVDNQVDCSSTGKRGKGKREPCPPNGGPPGGGDG